MAHFGWLKNHVLVLLSHPNSVLGQSPIQIWALPETHTKIEMICLSIRIMAEKGLVAKSLDIILLIMAAVYFVGFVSFHPESLLLKEAPYHIPHEYEIHFEILLWVFFGLLVLDLYLKYKKLNDWRLFMRKHWHEVVMIALIPFLSFFKIAKISVKLVKTLKASKSGFKIFYKAKKASKHLKK
jgi:hypothetical protein